MKLPIAIVAALAVAGCAATPRPSEIELATADYGAPPENYQEIIKKRMASVLRDPDSATYEFSMEPVKTWYVRGDVRSFGYGVCAHINSKNGFGGYTGQRKSYFLIRDGYVREDYHSDGAGSASEQTVYNLCSRL